MRRCGIRKNHVDFGVRIRGTNIGRRRRVIVLVEWCLVRLHVKVRLLERSWPLSMYLLENTLLSGKKLPV